MGILAEIDREMNKQLLEFIEKMDRESKDGKQFVFGDWLKRELADCLVRDDYKITGMCTQREPVCKVWVEFTMIEGIPTDQGGDI